MIETIMIFALGFLLASLCALLFLPAVNARAARLARRRMASLFPLTGVEVAAEKDYLRAQFAVERRQLERRIEVVGSTKHADMRAIGERTLEAAALGRTVVERETALTVKDGEIAEALGERDRVTENLRTTRADLAVGVSTLQILEDAHRHLLDDLLKARRRGPSVAVEAEPTSDPGSRETEDAASGATDSVGDTQPIDLQARITTLAAERESLRTSLAKAEEALARATAGAERDDAVLRSSIAAVADAFVRGERLPSVAAFPMPATAPDPS